MAEPESISRFRWNKADRWAPQWLTDILPYDTKFTVVNQENIQPQEYFHKKRQPPAYSPLNDIKDLDNQIMSVKSAPRKLFNYFL